MSLRIKNAIDQTMHEIDTNQRGFIPANQLMDFFYALNDEVPGFSLVDEREIEEIVREFYPEGTRKFSKRDLSDIMMRIWKK